jgi:hypothetical protein
MPDDLGIHDLLDDVESEEPAPTAGPNTKYVTVRGIGDYQPRQKATTMPGSARPAVTPDIVATAIRQVATIMWQ